MEPITKQHWMTFATFVQQNYFVFPKPETYYGVVLNANIVVHAPDAIAAFIISKTKYMRYLIDPITHAYQHDPSFISNSKKMTIDGKIPIKTSFKKLADQFSEKLAQKLGHALKPQDVQELLDEIVIGNLNFQRTFLSNRIKDSKDAKYLEKKEITPYAIIAPYFFMGDNSRFDDWLKINIQLIKETSTKIGNNEKIFSEIVFSKEILYQDDKIDSLIESYNSLENVDGHLIWIDEFDEQNCSKKQIDNYVKLIKGIRKKKTQEIINLHGGYFSILLSGDFADNTLTGIAHGPEFGEFRGVVPVGGGIPIARYYVPALHSRVKVYTVQQYFSALGYLEDPNIFHEKICNCNTCKEVINNDINNFSQFGESIPKTVNRGNRGYANIRYSSQNATKFCLEHYLRKKDEEFKELKNLTLETILSKLDDSYREYEVVADIQSIEYLKVWSKVLKDNFTRL